MPPTRPISRKIGAVTYLNSRPLTDGLADAFPDDDVRLDYPSRLASDLSADGLDLALVPVVELLRRCGESTFGGGACCRECDCVSPYRIVSDACIATCGAVRSVKVVFRRPPGAVRTLALDEGSRTSAALARLLLLERFGIEPELVPLPIEAAPADVDADALLMIGDRAIGPVPTNVGVVEVWDLGEEWYRWTGLPFVFAAWVGRRDRLDDMAAAGRTLSSVRDVGVAGIDELAERHGPPLGLTAKSAAEYLRHNLRFTLGRGELAGMTLFGKLAREAGLLPSGSDEPVAAADSPPVGHTSPGR
ncbi:MAG: menaquinone biosynthesis protein [Planctomycetota bacterium]